MLVGVIDIGKTHSRLVLLDADGTVVDQRSRRSGTVEAAGGWRALDTGATEAWLFDQLAALGAGRRRLRRLVVTTHGAAVAALAGERLALPVPDYEFEGFDERPAATLAQLDPFEETLSPVLARGLNLGLQLDWLSRHEARALARADCLLPYPQYWAWRLCGVAASEVSSLGCHTLLWNPGARDWSSWARRRGWARRFAPLRSAWDVLGSLRPELARRLGLAHDLVIHAGVHDSNACLARWLRHWPRMTLASTGTWVVVMAPGSRRPPRGAQADELGNVSVRNEVVPTARFMGGRELQALCAGADPALADLACLDALLARGILALPAPATPDGPLHGCAARVVDADGALPLSALGEAERATLAALYAAQRTVHLVERLGGALPVMLEGPFAGNPVIVAAMAALLPEDGLHLVLDDLEGTVRGAAMLTRWTDLQPAAPTMTAHAPAALRARLEAHHRRWLAALGPQAG
jgi:sugar (pentulose or hexulose) kinase